jgi:uncharacterized membrane protein
MAKRRSSKKRYQSSSRSSGTNRRKSEAEARVERVTWFLLVLLFAAVNFLPEGTLPNALIPFAGALVLLGSGLYQYAHRWQVSPITWIAGSIMMVMGLYSIYVDASIDFLPFSLIAFALVIGFGVLTGET